MFDYQGFARYIVPQLLYVYIYARYMQASSNQVSQKMYILFHSIGKVPSVNVPSHPSRLQYDTINLILELTLSSHKNVLFTSFYALFFIYYNFL